MKGSREPDAERPATGVAAAGATSETAGDSRGSLPAGERRWHGERGTRVRQWYSAPPERAVRGGAAEGEYWAFVPDAVAPVPDVAMPSRTADRVAFAERMLRELAPAHDLEFVAPLLYRDEALASSLVEGIGTTRRRLLETLAAAKRDPSSNEALVVANLDAHERALSLAGVERPLTTDDILSVHRVLLERYPAEARIAGQLRREPVWVGPPGSTPLDATYVAPPSERLPGLLDDLVEFVNRDDLNPVLQAAIAHCQFELIHPFADGNGRVGRALLHVVLRRRMPELTVTPPVSVVMAGSRGEYVGALAEARATLDPWLDYFAQAVSRAAYLTETLRSWVADLQATWRERLTVRADSAAAVLVERLPERPILTANDAAALIGRSPAAARLALRALAGAGIVDERTAQRRNRVWVATELVDLIEEFPWR